MIWVNNLYCKEFFSSLQLISIIPLYLAIKYIYYLINLHSKINALLDKYLMSKGDLLH